MRIANCITKVRNVLGAMGTSLPVDMDGRLIKIGDQLIFNKDPRHGPHTVVALTLSKSGGDDLWMVAATPKHGTWTNHDYSWLWRHAD